MMNDHTYTEYHRDPAQYPFLQIFQSNWQIIYDEYDAYINDTAPDKNLLNHVMSLKTSTIKAKEANKYNVIGLIFHGLTLPEFINKHQLVWPDLDSASLSEQLVEITHRYFSNTMRIANEAITSSNHVVRTVYFSTFAPGLDAKLHVNRDQHEYRGYLGLSVPDGDVAMKICGETLKWHNGEFMILDHDYPHCPHNKTDKARVALIVDFLKPDRPYQEMLELEQKIVSTRMKDNPYGYGVYGTDDVVPEEIFKKYGLTHQLDWQQSLA